MISVEDATMRYPVPKRWREYLLHPLRPAPRVMALEDVNVEIERGDSVALVGPNGAGKTTLLKLLGGLLYPTEGSVLIDGYDTVHHNLLARQKVGLVINEDRSFYWRLSGAQNLQFFGVLEDLFGEALHERIAEVLELVGLGHAGEKRVSDYSSGMRQRLAIARGLLADPEVLLLDEPTRSLDPVGARDIRRLISDGLHAQGGIRILVVTTNQIADVIGLCDRILVIHSNGIARAMRVEGRSETEITELYQQTVEEVP